MAYNHQLVEAPLTFTKGLNEKDGERHFSMPGAIGQGVMVLN